MNDNWLKTLISTAVVAMSCTSVVNAAPPTSGKIKVESGGGHSEVSSLAGQAATPQDADSAFVAQGCYDQWWLSGNHSWNWKSYALYSWNELTATTWTRYGTATAPCDIPLVSDWLRTKGNNRGATFNAAVDKTQYNVSTSSAYDKVTGTRSTAANVCGASVTHTAYKSGVQWNAFSRSGC